MAITDPLILPVDIVLVPVDDLPAHVREQLDYENGDHVITRPHSRTPSRIIDLQTAELLKQFHTPKTIVQAVIDYSRAKKLDPEQTLDTAFLMLRSFMISRLLVPADSEEARQISPSLEVGMQIAGFEVLRCIQVLEDTELYQVKSSNGELAALKILRRGCGNESLHMLEQEIAILECLDGRVNPALLETGTSEGRRYLIIEWCPGNDAFVATEELRHPDVHKRKKLLKLCCTILEAYSHLHAQGVIHADIHPRNVLVASNGAVKIVDYGLAHREGTASEGEIPRREGLGYFFEPEYALAVLAGIQPPQASMLGEQYSLAALLYFLFTGAHYLDFSLQKQVVLQQIAEESPLPFVRRGAVPWPDVEKLLAQALSKHVTGRFPSVHEFAHRLKQVVLGERDEPLMGMNAVGADAKAAEELLNGLLQRVGYSGPLLASPLTVAPTSSVYYGIAGIAYALYRIACVRGDAALLSLADVWATKAKRNIESSEAFYSSVMNLTSQTVGHISPYHTASGVHCVQALISQAMDDIVMQRSAIEAFVATSKAPCQNLDLVLGRSGTLLISSLLLDKAADSALLNRSSLLELGNRMLQGIWDEINAFAPIQECSEITHLGMAHGWAGFLYATLCWCQSSGSALPKAFKERLAQLAVCAESKGHGARWQWNIQQHGRKRESNYMPGWCNGSAGFIHLWTLAHQEFGDEEYLALAEKAAWNAWEEADNIGNLCCGLAGRAYGLLNLYRYSGERDWLSHAKELAYRAAVSQDFPGLYATAPYKALDARSNSLYKGEIGVAVLVAELSRPEESCMPFFEREG